MSRTKRGLGVAAALAAGAVAGAALEELLYRRVFRKPDPEGAEPIGAVPGESVWITSFDGTRLHARVYGPADAKRTLVLAHGAIESHVVWHYQVRDLLAEGGYRLVAYDARGHGSSGPARGPEGNTPFTSYTLARDLIAVVTQTTQGRVVLVGHSIGGMTILALWEHGEIVHIGDRVAGAAIVNGAYTADLRGWRGRGKRYERAIERVGDVLQQIPLATKAVHRIRPGMNDLTLLIGRLAYGSDPSPRHIETSIRMYEGTQSETLAAFVDFALFDAYDALRSVDVPFLVIGGVKDQITPVWQSEEIAAQIPEAELVILEDCGHLAPFERDEEVTSYLRKFAERVT